MIKQATSDAIRQCIVLGAHYLNNKVVEQVKILMEDCAGKYDVFLSYDNSRQDYDPSLFSGNLKTFLFDVKAIGRAYTMTNCTSRGRLYDGNTTFPILEFYRQHPHYEFYWRIEYDVRFSGNWTDLFDYFKDNDADLLTTTLFRHALRPEWEWWNSLKTPWYIGKMDKIRGFLPVARMSSKACKLMRQKYRRQWCGHDEVVVPTLLKHYGLRVEDIGGEGEFVRPENMARFYTNTPEKNGLAPGTMVCPPCKPDMPMRSGKLYHPIK